VDESGAETERLPEKAHLRSACSRVLKPPSAAFLRLHPTSHEFEQARRTHSMNGIIYLASVSVLLFLLIGWARHADKR
jgi:hypothetical protein